MASPAHKPRPKSEAPIPWTAPEVPAHRIRVESDRPLRRDGQHVVYWCIAQRRTAWNFGFQRALELAEATGKPLVFFEALRVDYPWASDRHHAFVLAGMAENRRRLEQSPVLYVPYVEPEPGAGRGLLLALAQEAVAVVTDLFPGFFLPGMVEAAAAQLGAKGTRLESVDSNGLLPLVDGSRTYPSAYAFRRQLQANLAPHLVALPEADPLQGRQLPAHGGLAGSIDRRWKPPSEALLGADARALSELPIDHRVTVATARLGGARAGTDRLRDFLERGLSRYHEERSEPAKDVSSGLSPYLHFGHVGAHQVFAALAAREGWTPARLSAQKSGKRAGWWGMGEAAEAFLDELVTWRELGYQCAAADPVRYETYAFQPEFARRTLDAHRGDRRAHLYSLEQLEGAQTHDPLWNAAQRQLVSEGHMHNYLRMLWGKKVLEWSEGPEVAFERLVHLNNRFALDGRNPNSYSGIGWVLGRFDRPWGPERQIFGTVRYMSSDNTAKKFDVKPYLARYGKRDGLF